MENWEKWGNFLLLPVPGVLLTLSRLQLEGLLKEGLLKAGLLKEGWLGMT